MCTVTCLTSFGEVFRISLAELIKKAEMMNEHEVLRRLEKYTKEKSRWHNTLLMTAKTTNINYKELLTKP